MRHEHDDLLRKPASRYAAGRRRCPVTGVVLGALVAGEALTGRQLTGLSIVLAGIALGQLRMRRSAQSPSDSRNDRVGAKNVDPVAAVEKSRIRS